MPGSPSLPHLYLIVTGRHPVLKLQINSPFLAIFGFLPLPPKGPLFWLELGAGETEGRIPQGRNSKL